VAVHFAGFHNDMLWHSKAMWYKLPEPVWDGKDASVLFFFVHGSHDLVEPEGNGGVVPVTPIEKGISLCDGCTEVVWVTKGNYSWVLSD